MKIISLLVALASMTLVAAGNNASASTTDTLHASSLEPEPEGKKVAPPVKKVDPALVEIKDVPGLPRMLLIGDSISIGYTLPVRALLKGRANVHRVLGNCGDTGRGLAHLDEWIGANYAMGSTNLPPAKWDVIHFNFGLHDLKYLDGKGHYISPEQGKQVASPAKYEQNLRLLVERLKKTGARLVFATTTPVPAGTLGRVENDEVRYNEVAVRVMKENGVVIDDLHAVVTRQLVVWQRPKNVHFTPAGYEKLAAAVVASVMPLLPAAPK